jgi:hypothetical protein
MSGLIDIVAALGWMVGAAAFVLVVHALARQLIGSEPAGPDGHDQSLAARDIAQAAGFRIAALYGVLLALVYAQELADYQGVRDGLAREAVAIADVWHDAGRYGAPLAAVVQPAMARYVTFVVEREWYFLGEERRLSQKAWEAREIAYRAVLDAEPGTAAQVSLRERMIVRLRDIAEDRHIRGEMAARGFGAIFWAPAIIGLGLVAIPFHVFPPTRQARVMLVAFGGFAGLILFFIQGFSNPFRGPIALSPAPFERLMEQGIGSPAGEARP